MSFDPNRYEVTLGQYGVFIKDKFKGRSRYMACSPEKLAKLNLADALEKTSRTFAQGTHEHMVLYRDANGEIGVPPEPDMIPDGATPFTVNSLAEADRVCREMKEQFASRFQGDSEFTETMEEVFGSPREHLLYQMARTSSNLERDSIREMLADLDREEADRLKLNTDMRFHWREC